MAPSTTSTLTIQPWTNEPTTTHSLNDVLSRAQRGHFRDITESSLQEELAAEGALDSSSSASSEDEEEDEDTETTAKKNAALVKPSTREHLYDAKRYMLQAIEAARQEVSVAQDMMSLVVSKHMPTQAATTLGSIVHNKVPLGTMGVDFWQRMPADPAREAQDKLLATNVRMDALQSAADGLLGAAKRMEEGVRRETEYWDQILSISERGWNVCRIPGQQHRLGVRFGFSESAPQFSRKGIAALNPDREGGIRLERGVGSKPRALRAVLRRGEGGRVVGASRVPAVQDAEETTLEAKIRYARDSLFDEEVFHEVLRESRTLGSVGVGVEGNTVTLRNSNAGDEGLEVSLDLVSLDEDNSIPDAEHEKDNLAQATVLTARLLLSQAHRDKLRKRSEPPAPLSEKQKDDKPVLPILRPLLALMLHHSALGQLTTYLDSTSSTLKAAKIEHTFQPPRLPAPEAGDGKAAMSAETLLTTTLLRPLNSTATLTLKPPAAGDTQTPMPETESQTFAITLSTSLASSFGPTYTLTSPNGKAFSFHDFPFFASATSALLSSALAGALLPVVRALPDVSGDEWKLKDEEAVVERDVGVGETEQSFTTDLDGVKGELELVFSGEETRAWSWKAKADANRAEPLTTETNGAESGKEGFFDAARSCLT